MATAVEVWTTLVKYGVTLPVPEGQLRTRAPTGGLTETLRQTIREHKAGPMTLLTPDPTHGVQRDCAVSPTGQDQRYGLSSGGVKGLRCLVAMGHAPSEVSA